jgi:hypothetical protein
MAGMGRLTERLPPAADIFVYLKYHSSESLTEAPDKVVAPSLRQIIFLKMI